MKMCCEERGEQNRSNLMIGFDANAYHIGNSVAAIQTNEMSILFNSDETFRNSVSQGRLKVFWCRDISVVFIPLCIYKSSNSTITSDHKPSAFADMDIWMK